MLPLYSLLSVPSLSHPSPFFPFLMVIFYPDFCIYHFFAFLYSLTTYECILKWQIVQFCVFLNFTWMEACSSFLLKHVLFIFPQHTGAWSSSMLTYVAVIYFHGYIVFHLMNKLLQFIHSVSCYLNHRFSAIWNNARVNIIVHMSWVRILWGIYLGAELLNCKICKYSTLFETP